MRIYCLTSFIYSACSARTIKCGVSTWNMCFIYQPLIVYNGCNLRFSSRILHLWSLILSTRSSILGEGVLITVVTVVIVPIIFILLSNLLILHLGSLLNYKINSYLSLLYSKDFRTLHINSGAKVRKKNETCKLFIIIRAKKRIFLWETGQKQ